MGAKFILAATLTLVLIAAVFYFYGDGQVPAGQAPLERLTPQSVGSLENAFNAAKDDVRVLLLLSPT
jgi:hypothetical protein